VIDRAGTVVVVVAVDLAGASVCRVRFLKDAALAAA
jgi:hypothetical protein